MSARSAWTGTTRPCFRPSTVLEFLAIATAAAVVVGALRMDPAVGAVVLVELCRPSAGAVDEVEIVARLELGIGRRELLALGIGSMEAAVAREEEEERLSFPVESCGGAGVEEMGSGSWIMGFFTFRCVSCPV